MSGGPRETPIGWGDVPDGTVLSIKGEIHEGRFTATVERINGWLRADWEKHHAFPRYTVEPVGGSPRETDWDAQVERVAMAMWAEYRMGFVARGGAPLPPPDWPEITHDARTNYRARARAALSTAPPETDHALNTHPVCDMCHERHHPRGYCPRAPRTETEDHDG